MPLLIDEFRRPPLTVSLFLPVFDERYSSRLSIEIGESPSPISRRVNLSTNLGNEEALQKRDEETNGVTDGSKGTRATTLGRDDDDDGSVDDDGDMHIDKSSSRKIIVCSVSGSSNS